MNLCVTVEGSPQVNAVPSSSSSTWPEMSNKSNPVSLLPHLVCSVRYYLQFHVTTVGLGMYYLWIQWHYCILYLPEY
jgi:hypothetical protein